ncbi:MAG: tryptophan-rich sensory protein [Gemmatimonadetes bacterium]|nr:tryptophan-rich sensory protein [Gemmatimonadota bacterium]
MGVASWRVWGIGLDQPGVTLALGVYVSTCCSMGCGPCSSSGSGGRTGEWMMVPYVAWVGFAAVLNAAIVHLDPGNTAP